MKKLLFIMSLMYGLLVAQEISSCKNYYTQTDCLYDLLELSGEKAYELSYKLCFDRDSVGACVAIIKNPIIQTMPKQERIELVNKTGEQICSLQSAKIASKNSHSFCLPVAKLALEQKDTQKAISYSKNGCKASDMKACKLYTKLTGKKMLTKEEKIKKLKAEANELLKVAKKTKDQGKVYGLRKKAEMLLDTAIVLQVSGEEGMFDEDELGI